MTPDKMPPNLMSEVFTLCEGAPNLKLGALSLGFFFLTVKLNNLRKGNGLKCDRHRFRLFSSERENNRLKV